METQGQHQLLTDTRVAGGVPLLVSGLIGVDRRIGSSYEALANRPIIRALGRLFAALLFTILLISKWQAATRLLSAGLPAATDFNSWANLLNYLLQVPFLTLAVALVVIRRQARSGNATLSGIVIALGGTLVTTLFVYESNKITNSWISPISVVLLIAGMGWAIWSLSVLGRCFGVVPEARGLVTRGPYNWIRHPIYLGEIVATLGLLLTILSPWTLLVFALFVVLQILRTRYEEAGLEAAFPEYGAYRQRTRRLIPGIW